MLTIALVGFWSFLFHFIWTSRCNIYACVAYFETREAEDETSLTPPTSLDLWVPVPLVLRWISGYRFLRYLSDPTSVSEILNQDDDELSRTFVQAAFNTACGRFGFTNINRDGALGFHRQLKTDLSQDAPLSSADLNATGSTKKESISSYAAGQLRLASGTVFGRAIVSRTSPELLDAFEDLGARFWCRTAFGRDAKFSDYKELRRLTMKVLRSTFYDNPFRFLPVVGSLWTRFLVWWHRGRFDRIESLLQKLSTGADHPCVAAFLRDQDPSNAFLLVLVQDFLQGMFIAQYCNRSLGETPARHTKVEIENVAHIRRRNIVRDVSQCFLFPFRPRHRDGAFVLLDLVRGNHLWLAGKRACVGQPLVRELHEVFEGILDTFVLAPVLEWRGIAATTGLRERPDWSLLKGVPLGIQASRSSVADSLPRTKHVWHVHEFFESDWRSTLAIKWMAGAAHASGVEVIVCPEARGWLVGSRLQSETQLPTVYVRKGNKLPHRPDNIRIAYNSAISSSNEIEMAASSQAIVRGRIVGIVDDGISTGGSFAAVENLCRRAGARECRFFAIFRHGPASSEGGGREQVETGTDAFGCETLFHLPTVGGLTSSS